MCAIYIVQHCQSEHHVNELTGGWTDTPLTELGELQAKAVAKQLKKFGLSDFTLYSSDLKRAKMTADFISEEFNIAVNQTKKLREINNGEAAGKNVTWANNNKLIDLNELVLDKPVWQGAETPRELFERMNEFVNEKLLPESNDIVIVCHGVAIAYLISAWMKMAPELLVDTFFAGRAGGLSCLSRNHLNQNVINFFNTTSHLNFYG